MHAADVRRAVLRRVGGRVGWLVFFAIPRRDDFIRIPRNHLNDKGDVVGIGDQLMDGVNCCPIQSTTPSKAG